MESRGNGATRYSIANLPEGIMLESDLRQLMGTPTSPMAKTPLTYRADDNDAPGDTLIFNLSVAPQAPQQLTVHSEESSLTLMWLPHPDPNVTWELNDGDAFSSIQPTAADVPSEDPNVVIQMLTYEITGISNRESYTFTLRGVIGTGEAKVAGVEASVETVAVPPTPKRAHRPTG